MTVFKKALRRFLKPEPGLTRPPTPSPLHPYSHLNIEELRELFQKDPFAVLRKKWGEVPGAADRHSTALLFGLSDQELVQHWIQIKMDAVSGKNFPVRGWYHALYTDILRGKRVMDVGSGLGIDGITFAEAGAEMTFVDIVESNLKVLKRLCQLRGIRNATFCYLQNLSSLGELPTDYDVIWCQGSMINAPFSVMKDECAALLTHLPVGGRWIELAYPKIRWEREGSLPFNVWGEYTDGQGTPWMEWYDLQRIQARLAPAAFETILYVNFHNNDFNWFDLIRRT
jgi:hypothetical protein